MRVGLGVALVCLIACIGCRLEPEAKAPSQTGAEQNEAKHHRWLVSKRLTDIRQNSLIDGKKALDSLTALRNTIREKKLLIDRTLMAEIDDVIEEHGGWPGAFQVEGEKEPSDSGKRPVFGETHG